eukprot:TRINITY_DN93475_c0_g1_i1.p1 TRINITY_DN93475_c0_g1~~TRINITY_DN93475_c0_g1_i1.p1  ORF type:complete len:257 (-),score=58.49 TRINITY_DN93475_c0_g1_i1:214-984(-)
MRRSSALLVFFCGCVFARHLIGPCTAWLSMGEPRTSHQNRVLGMRVARAAAESAVEEAAPVEVQSGMTPPEEETMGKFWVNQPGQISFEVEWSRGDKIRDLKAVIEKVAGIPVDKQELRGNGESMGVDGQQLEAIQRQLTDVWVLDERDDSEERGEYNPDPEPDMSPFATPLKIGIYLFAFVFAVFWVTQMLEINPYANWPEGPRMDWSKVPPNERPGGIPSQPNGYGQFNGVPGRIPAPEELYSAKTLEQMKSQS